MKTLSVKSPQSATLGVSSLCGGRKTKLETELCTVLHNAALWATAACRSVSSRPVLCDARTGSWGQGGGGGLSHAGPRCIALCPQEPGRERGPKELGCCLHLLQVERTLCWHKFRRQLSDWKEGDKSEVSASQVILTDLKEALWGNAASWICTVVVLPSLLTTFVHFLN